LQDPTWERSGRTDPGRDGCRVPIPWSGTEVPFGFSPPGSAPAWLPQPEWFAGYTAEAQDDDPNSMLNLYRAVLAARRAHPALGDGTLQWLPSGERVLAFRRDPGFVCVVNFGTTVVALPAHRDVIVASAPLRGGLLPADAAAWLAV
jgi:alpha-glucosidase